MPGVIGFIDNNNNNNNILHFILCATVIRRSKDIGTTRVCVYPHSHAQCTHTHKQTRSKCYVPDTCDTRTLTHAPGVIRRAEEWERIEKEHRPGTTGVLPCRAVRVRAYDVMLWRRTRARRALRWHGRRRNICRRKKRAGAQLHCHDRNEQLQKKGSTKRNRTEKKTKRNNDGRLARKRKTGNDSPRRWTGVKKNKKLLYYTG